MSAALTASIGLRDTLKTSHRVLCQLEEARLSTSMLPTWVLQNSPYRRWLPIMKAYEGGSAAYFATPPVNLIRAYHESLSQITKASPSLDERLERHCETSNRIKGAAAELGLSQVPASREIAANGMTAVGTIKTPLTRLVFAHLYVALVPGWCQVLRPSPRLLAKGCRRGRWSRHQEGYVFQSLSSSIAIVHLSLFSPL